MPYKPQQEFLVVQLHRTGADERLYCNPEIIQANSVTHASELYDLKYNVPSYFKSHVIGEIIDGKLQIPMTKIQQNIVKFNSTNPNVKYDTELKINNLL